MQELRKFGPKVNVIPNRLAKYMSLSFESKLFFIDSFQFLSSSWNSLVQNLGQYYFKHLSQETDSEVLELVKQKGF